MKHITKSRKRGTILFFAMLFSAVIGLLAMAYVRAIPTEANSFLRSQRSILAHYAAEAAVFDVMARIRHDIENDVEPTSDVFEGELNKWKWRATLSVDADNPPTGTSSLRFYEIYAEAFPPGVPIDSQPPARTVRATMGEETFARYSRFIDDWGPIYANFSGPNKIQGHYHTNTQFEFNILDPLYDGLPGTPPAMNGYVTSVGQHSGSEDGVEYRNNSGPTDDAQYELLYRGGKSGINTGVAEIGMPASSDAIAREAWGESSVMPDTSLPLDDPGAPTPGLYVNTDATGGIDGGYFVAGHIDTMELGLDPSGNSMITFTQGNPPPPLPPPPPAPLPLAPPVTPGPEEFTIIEATEAPATLAGTTAPVGSTLVVTPTGPTVYPSHSNGVFYASGSIWSLQGENKGSRLIAVESLTEQSVVITGSVTRQDTTPGEIPDGSDDVLGILSHQLILHRDIPRITTAPLHMYFSYLAGRRNDPNPTDRKGGLKVELFADTSLGTGTFYLYGASGAGHNGATGDTYTDPDTGVTSTIAGFGFAQRFDPHILENPPPFYPTTGKLPITSWREESGSH